MLTKSDLEKLAQIRLEDSVFLLQAGRSSSAYYLAGYAVELALKACISKLIQAYVIPEKAFITAIYTHRLDNLLSVAGLLPEFNADAKADAEFAAYWAITSKWTEESRYEFWDPMSAATLLQAIHEPNHGVFQWVKKHW
jgi:HEPN domain-containing protein